MPVLVLPWGDRSSATAVIGHLTELGLDPKVQWPGEADGVSQRPDSSEIFVLGILGRQTQATQRHVDTSGHLGRLRALASDPHTIGGAILAAKPHRLPDDVGILTVARLDGDGAWREALTDALRQTRFLVEGGELRRRVAKALDELGRGLFEREDAIRLSLLSALARESIFLLGPPGVAKSLIARRLKYIFAPGAKSFEYLMNRFSTPDEIFGPVSIEGLKRGELRRITDFYLPDATVVFLDEIWKAGPSIQNALLTVLNERVFRNGGCDQRVKLRALLSASNELPAAGEGLGALWDRFLVRVHIDNVESAPNRHKLIRGASDLEVPRLEHGDRFLDRELAAIDRAIDQVPIPDRVLAVIDGVIEQIRVHNQRARDERRGRKQGDPDLVSEAGADFVDDEDEEDGRSTEIYVSDRRWKKIGRLLRASALLNGRQAVDLIDCFLISYCIWNAKGQIEIVREMVEASIYQPQVPTDLQAELAALIKAFDSLPKLSSRTPRLLRGHFRIDLSSDRDKDLLTAPETGRTYNWLAKAECARLGREAGVVRLTAPAGGGQPAATVELMGRQGNSALEIVLENPADSAPLHAFKATRFRLIADQGRVTSLDLKHPEARTFAAGLDAFRRRLAAARADLAERKPELPDQVAGHLFLWPSHERAMKLSDALNAVEGNLARMSETVARLGKDLGVG